MADNPLKYSDLVIPDDSITNLIEQLKEMAVTFDSAMKGIVTSAQKTETSLKGVSGATNEGKEAIKSSATEVDRLAKAHKDLEFAQSENAKTLAALKLQQNEQNNINKLTEKLNNSLEGSYNRLSAQYSLNKIKINQMSQEWRETTKEGMAFVAETNQIYQSMIKLQSATGKHTLSVGNYAKAWDGLGNSASQLTRELPVLAMNAQMFFLAISNNIPIMVDEIGRLRDANTALNEKGIKTPPIWKSVLKSFASFNTLIMIGVSLLTIFGGDIVKWVQKLIKGKEAIDEVYLAQKSFNEAQLNGLKGAQSELVRLKLLYDATQDTTKSINERKRAVDELQEQFPTYFKGLSDEKILAGEATEQYNQLAKSILATARARANEEEIVKNTKELIELEKKQAVQESGIYNKRVQLDLILAKSSKLQTENSGMAGQAFTGVYNEEQKARNALRASQVEFDKTTTKINSLTKANEKLAKSISVTDLTATPGKIDKGDEAAKREAERRKREEEKIRKEREDIAKNDLDFAIKSQESETALMNEGLQKKRVLLFDNYKKEVAELQFKLDNEKNLTESARADINDTITNYGKKLIIDLGKLRDEDNKQQLQKERTYLENRLDGIEKGSIEENNLKIKLLENQRKQELLENSKLEKSMRQDEIDINDKYNKLILKQDRDFYVDKQMLALDMGQELAQSEFDLLKKSEGDKTRFRLQAEKDRLQKLLDLGESNGKKLTEQQIKTIQNLIKKIGIEMDESRKKDNMNIYSLMGLDQNEEYGKAMDAVVSKTIENIRSIISTYVEMADTAVQKSQERVDASKNALDKEIEARNNGYASNVVQAQRELELERKSLDKSQKEKAKAVKAQQALDTIMQTSSLITATAQIFSSLSGIPIVGWALAIAAVAAMWGTFAVSKVKAAQLAKAQTYGEGGYEFLDGGSHSSGNDISIGRTKDGRERRAEGGETLAIIRKSQTQKYRNIIPDVINSLNKGVFEKRYMHSYDTAGLSINVTAASSNVKELEKDVRAIKEQGERKYFVNGKGQLVEKYKNLTRVYKP